MFSSYDEAPISRKDHFHEDWLRYCEKTGFDPDEFTIEDYLDGIDEDEALKRAWDE